jgi:hypothetical protein
VADSDDKGDDELEEEEEEEDCSTPGNALVDESTDLVISGEEVSH